MKTHLLKSIAVLLVAALLGAAGPTPAFALRAVGLEEGTEREEVARELGVPPGIAGARATRLAEPAPRSYSPALASWAQLFVNAHRARAIIPPDGRIPSSPSPTTPFGQSTAGLEEGIEYYGSVDAAKEDYPEVAAFVAEATWKLGRPPEVVLAVPARTRLFATPAALTIWRQHRTESQDETFGLSLITVAADSSLPAHAYLLVGTSGAPDEMPSLRDRRDVTKVVVTDAQSSDELLRRLFSAKAGYDIERFEIRLTGPTTFIFA